MFTIETVVLIADELETKKKSLRFGVKKYGKHRK